MSIPKHNRIRAEANTSRRDVTEMLREDFLPELRTMWRVFSHLS
jgi:hypothetical protein